MVVAATGFFDGVHKGHRAVLDRVVSIAKKEGKSSAVITFWPHPRTVLQQDAAKFRLLTTLDEKRELLHKLGIDKVHVLTFDKEFAQQSTKLFFEKYLKEMFNVSTLVAGYDHRVGHDTSQTQEEMFAIARECGIEPIRVGQFGDTKGEIIISSTKIREALSKGNINFASSMLGYNYALYGVVVEGRKIGRTMGYPTANIKLYEPLKLLPANGVYATFVQVQEKRFKAIVNIGTRPTVSTDTAKSIEAHIIDFGEDIYGLPLKLELIQRLRDEQKFDSIEHLRVQLGLDREAALRIL